MKVIVAFVLLSINALSVTFAQETIDWARLSDVAFTDQFDTERGINYQEAIFGPGVVPLDGQDVVIIGYVIPLDAYGIGYALSRNPNASCFFCGGAGPETVLELRLKPSAMRRYRTDDRRYFRGTLQLNISNADNFTYVLLNAEAVSY
ncbi:MAG: DUF3299 domain-containing protein [Bacteroidia bacterium]|nr:DUF3299 domain-containing protein [Bacteroidia bacterium]